MSLSQKKYEVCFEAYVKYWTDMDEK